MIVFFKNIFSKKIILPITITTIFWLIIFLFGINLFEKKLTEIKNITTFTAKNTSKINKSATPTLIETNRSSNPDQSEKIYEKGDISLYKDEPLVQASTSLFLKKKEQNDRSVIKYNINYYFDGTMVCDTSNPNIVSYSASFSDMGAHSYNSLYINTENNKTIEIKTGNSSYGLTIYDEINDYFHSSIEPSINDQCNNKNIKKAWIKDLMLNNYLQGIFPKEYEIECIKDGDLGDLVYFSFEGINKTLDKIFFKYETTKFSDTELKDESYSYDLINHKIKAEEPNNLLKGDYNCQHLEYGNDIDELILKTDTNN